MDLGTLHALLRGTGISVSKIIENNKASEVYVKTKFVQDNGFEWDTYVPYVDRRAGLNIETEQDLADYLKSLKQYFTKDAMKKYRTSKMLVIHWHQYQDQMGKKDTTEFYFLFRCMPKWVMKHSLPNSKHE